MAFIYAYICIPCKLHYAFIAYTLYIHTYIHTYTHTFIRSLRMQFITLGGVHFGGLSHLFGMGSDQILGLTMLTSNGSLVRIHSSELTTGANLTCSRDSSAMTDGQCEDIWFAVRGAGSSFGLVTSLTGAITFRCKHTHTYTHTYIHTNIHKYIHIV